MTALQWIVKEAKAQKNKYPTKFKTWKEYIKQASKQYNTGIKPSFPKKNKVGAVNKKAAPKKKAAKKIVKKKVAKKVFRKIVKKKAAPKKKVAKKKLTRKDYDKRFQADKPGKRTSASGNTYYEYRENRVDYGKLLGIGFTLDKYNRLKK